MPLIIWYTTLDKRQTKIYAQFPSTLPRPCIVTINSLEFISTELITKKFHKKLFFNPLLYKLFLDSSTRKEHDEKCEYLGKIKMPFLNCIEINVGNGAFARYVQMLHFLQCFQ